MEICCVDFNIHVYKCMKIQIPFRQYNNQNFPRSLRSLEVKLHVYIWFFVEIAWFDLNDFHTRMYACMVYDTSHLAACTCVYMHANLYILQYTPQSIKVGPPNIESFLAYENWEPQHNHVCVASISSMSSLFTCCQSTS